MSTTQKCNKRAKYPSDISKRGWQVLKKMLPASKSNKKIGGRPSLELKEVVNAIFYVLKNGCTWRSLSHEEGSCTSRAIIFKYCSGVKIQGAPRRVSSQSTLRIAFSK